MPISKIFFGRIRFTQKIWAIFVSLCLVPVDARAFSLPAFSPSSFATIEEFHQGSNGKTIFYIQDAHSSFSAQESIYLLIDHLTSSQQIRTVFQEGYEGRVPLDEIFRGVPEKEIKQKVSYFLLDRLRLSGAEYAYANRKNPFRLIGIDHDKLYRWNIQAYREAAKDRKLMDQDLMLLSERLERLGKEGFSPRFKKWRKIKEAFENEELELPDYLRQSVGLLPELSLKRYRLLQLLFLESQSASPSKIRYDQILRRYSASGLLPELEDFEKRLSGHFLADETSQTLFQYLTDVQLAGKLLHLEISEQEFKNLRDQWDKISTQKMADFVSRESRKSVVLYRGWEKALPKAIRFYELAQARDQQLGKKLERFKKASSENTAVLVFGGFHKQAIRQILINQGYSFYILTPNAGDEDGRHENYYKQIMLAGNLPFEISAQVKTAAIQERLVNGDLVWASAQVSRLADRTRRFQNLPPVLLHPLLERAYGPNFTPGRKIQPVVQKNSRSELRISLNDFGEPQKSRRIKKEWLNQFGDLVFRLATEVNRDGKHAPGAMKALESLAKVPLKPEQFSDLNSAFAQIAWSAKARYRDRAIEKLLGIFASTVVHGLELKEMERVYGDAGRDLFQMLKTLEGSRRRAVIRKVREFAIWNRTMKTEGFEYFQRSLANIYQRIPELQGEMIAILIFAWDANRNRPKVFLESIRPFLFERGAFLAKLKDAAGNNNRSAKRVLAEYHRNTMPHVYPRPAYRAGSRRSELRQDWKTLEGVGGLIELNEKTGRIRYAPNAVSGFKLRFKLFASRHGETDANLEGIFQGVSDGPKNQLNPKGLRQAEEAAGKLWELLKDSILQGKDPVVVSSRMNRAKTTAKVFIGRVRQETGREIKLIEDPQAHEMAYGEMDGLEVNQWTEAHRTFNTEYRNGEEKATQRFPGVGGESFIDALKRAYALLQKWDNQWGGTNQEVVYFGHGAILSAIRMLLLDPSMADASGHLHWRSGPYMIPHATPVQLQTFSRSELRSADEEKFRELLDRIISADPNNALALKAMHRQFFKYFIDDLEAEKRGELSQSEEARARMSVINRLRDLEEGDGRLLYITAFRDQDKHYTSGAREVQPFNHPKFKLLDYAYRVKRVLEGRVADQALGEMQKPEPHTADPATPRENLERYVLWQQSRNFLGENPDGKKFPDPYNLLPLELEWEDMGLTEMWRNLHFGFEPQWRPEKELAEILVNQEIDRVEFVAPDTPARAPLLRVYFRKSFEDKGINYEESPVEVRFMDLAILSDALPYPDAQTAFQLPDLVLDHAALEALVFASSAKPREKVEKIGKILDLALQRKIISNGRYYFYSDAGIRQFAKVFSRTPSEEAAVFGGVKINLVASRKGGKLERLPVKPEEIEAIKANFEKKKKAARFVEVMGLEAKASDPEYARRINSIGSLWDDSLTAFVPVLNIAFLRNAKGFIVDSKDIEDFRASLFKIAPMLIRAGPAVQSTADSLASNPSHLSHYMILVNFLLYNALLLSNPNLFKRSQRAGQFVETVMASLEATLPAGTPKPRYGGFPDLRVDTAEHLEEDLRNLKALVAGQADGRGKSPAGTVPSVSVPFETMSLDERIDYLIESAMPLSLGLADILNRHRIFFSYFKNRNIPQTEAQAYAAALEYLRGVFSSISGRGKVINDLVNPDKAGGMQFTDDAEKMNVLRSITLSMASGIRRVTAGIKVSAELGNPVESEEPKMTETTADQYTAWVRNLLIAANADRKYLLDVPTGVAGDFDRRTYSGEDSASSPFAILPIIAYRRLGFEPTLDVVSGIVERGVEAVKAYPGYEGNPPYLVLRFFVPLEDKFSLSEKHKEVAVVLFNAPWDFQQAPQAEMDIEKLRAFEFDEKTNPNARMEKLGQILEYFFTDRTAARSRFRISFNRADQVAKTLGRTAEEEKAVRDHIQVHISMKPGIVESEDQKAAKTQRLRERFGIIKNQTRFLSEIGAFPEIVLVQGASERISRLEAPVRRLMAEAEALRPVLFLPYVPGKTGSQREWLITDKDFKLLAASLEKPEVQEALITLSKNLKSLENMVEAERWPAFYVAVLTEITHQLLMGDNSAVRFDIGLNQLKQVFGDALKLKTSVPSADPLKIFQQIVSKSGLETSSFSEMKGLLELWLQRRSEQEALNIFEAARQELRSLADRLLQIASGLEMLAGPLQDRKYYPEAVFLQTIVEIKEAMERQDILSAAEKFAGLNIATKAAAGQLEPLFSLLSSALDKLLAEQESRNDFEALNKTLQAAIVMDEKFSGAASGQIVKRIEAALPAKREKLEKIQAVLNSEIRNPSDWERHYQTYKEEFWKIALRALVGGAVETDLSAANQKIKEHFKNPHAVAAYRREIAVFDGVVGFRRKADSGKLKEAREKLSAVQNITDGQRAGLEKLLTNEDARLSELEAARKLKEAEDRQRVLAGAAIEARGASLLGPSPSVPAEPSPVVADAAEPPVHADVPSEPTPAPIPDAVATTVPALPAKSESSLVPTVGLDGAAAALAAILKAVHPDDKAAIEAELLKMSEFVAGQTEAIKKRAEVNPGFEQILSIALLAVLLRNHPELFNRSDRDQIERVFYDSLPLNAELAEKIRRFALSDESELQVKMRIASERLNELIAKPLSEKVAGQLDDPLLQIEEVAEADIIPITPIPSMDLADAKKFGSSLHRLQVWFQNLDDQKRKDAAQGYFQMMENQVELRKALEKDDWRAAGEHFRKLPPSDPKTIEIRKIYFKSWAAELLPVLDGAKKRFTAGTKRKELAGELKPFEDAEQAFRRVRDTGEMKDSFIPLLEVLSEKYHSYADFSNQMNHWVSRFQSLAFQRSELRMTFYERGQMLLESQGEITTAQAYSLYDETPGGAITQDDFVVRSPKVKKYLLDPENWIEERRPIQAVIEQEVIAEVRRLSNYLSALAGNPVIVLLRGNTGSGKTTTIQSHSWFAGAPRNARGKIVGVINPDAVVARLRDADRIQGNRTTNYLQAFLEANIMTRRIRTVAEKEKLSFVLDKRFEEHKDIEDVISFARENGYRLRVIDVDAPLELSINRVLARDYQNPESDAPWVDFNDLREGFLGVRTNRRLLIEAVQKDPLITHYELFGTSDLEDQILVARKDETGFAVYDQGFLEGITDPNSASSGKINLIVNQPTEDGSTLIQKLDAHIRTYRNFQRGATRSELRNKKDFEKALRNEKEIYRRVKMVRLFIDPASSTEAFSRRDGVAVSDSQIWKYESADTKYRTYPSRQYMEALARMAGISIHLIDPEILKQDLALELEEGKRLKMAREFIGEEPGWFAMRSTLKTQGISEADIFAYEIGRQKAPKGYVLALGAAVKVILPDVSQEKILSLIDRSELENQIRKQSTKLERLKMVVEFLVGEDYGKITEMQSVIRSQSQIRAYLNSKHADHTEPPNEFIRAVANLAGVRAHVIDSDILKEEFLREADIRKRLERAHELLKGDDSFTPREIAAGGLPEREYVGLIAGKLRIKAKYIDRRFFEDELKKIPERHKRLQAVLGFIGETALSLGERSDIALSKSNIQLLITPAGDRSVRPSKKYYDFFAQVAALAQIQNDVLLLGDEVKNLILLNNQNGAEQTHVNLSLIRESLGETQETMSARLAKNHIAISSGAISLYEKEDPAVRLSPSPAYLTALSVLSDIPEVVISKSRFEEELLAASSDEARLQIVNQRLDRGNSPAGETLAALSKILGIDPAILDRKILEQRLSQIPERHLRFGAIQDFLRLEQQQLAVRLGAHTSGRLKVSKGQVGRYRSADPQRRQTPSEDFMRALAEIAEVDFNLVIAETLAPPPSIESAGLPLTSVSHELQPAADPNVDAAMNFHLAWKHPEQPKARRILIGKQAYIFQISSFEKAAAWFWGEKGFRHLGVFTFKQTSEGIIVDDFVPAVSQEEPAVIPVAEENRFLSRAYTETKMEGMKRHHEVIPFGIHFIYGKEQGFFNLYSSDGTVHRVFQMNKRAELRAESYNRRGFVERLKARQSEVTLKWFLYELLKSNIELMRVTTGFPRTDGADLEKIQAEFRELILNLAKIFKLAKRDRSQWATKRGLRREVLNSVAQAGVLMIEKNNRSAASASLNAAVTRLWNVYLERISTKLGRVRRYRQNHGTFYQDSKTGEWVLLRRVYRDFKVGEDFKVPVAEYKEIRYKTMWEAFRSVDHEIDNELQYESALNRASKKLAVIERDLATLKDQAQGDESRKAAVIRNLEALIPELDSKWIIEKELAQLGSNSALYQTQLNAFGPAHTSIGLVRRLLEARAREVKSMIDAIEGGRLKEMRRVLEFRDSEFLNEVTLMEIALRDNSRAAFDEKADKMLSRLRNNQEPDLLGVSDLIRGAKRTISEMLEASNRGDLGRAGEKRTQTQKYLSLAKKLFENASALHEWMASYRGHFTQLRREGKEVDEAQRQAFQAQFHVFIQEQSISERSLEATIWWYRFYQTVFIPLNIDDPKKADQRIANPVFLAFSALIRMLEINDIAAMIRNGHVFHHRHDALKAFLLSVADKGKIAVLAGAEKEQMLRALAEDFSKDSKVPVTYENLRAAYEYRRHRSELRKSEFLERSDFERFQEMLQEEARKGLEETSRKGMVRRLHFLFNAIQAEVFYWLVIFEFQNRKAKSVLNGSPMPEQPEQLGFYRSLFEQPRDASVFAEIKARNRKPGSRLRNDSDRGYAWSAPLAYLTEWKNFARKAANFIYQTDESIRRQLKRIGVGDLNQKELPLIVDVDAFEKEMWRVLGAEEQRFRIPGDTVALIRSVEGRKELARGFERSIARPELRRTIEELKQKIAELRALTESSPTIDPQRRDRVGEELTSIVINLPDLSGVDQGSLLFALKNLKGDSQLANLARAAMSKRVAEIIEASDTNGADFSDTAAALSKALSEVTIGKIGYDYEYFKAWFEIVTTLNLIIRRVSWPHQNKKITLATPGVMTQSLLDVAVSTGKIDTKYSEANEVQKLIGQTLMYLLNLLEGKELNEVLENIMNAFTSLEHETSAASNRSREAIAHALKTDRVVEKLEAPGLKKLAHFLLAVSKGIPGDGSDAHGARLEVNLVLSDIAERIDARELPKIAAHFVSLAQEVPLNLSNISRGVTGFGVLRTLASRMRPADLNEMRNSLISLSLALSESGNSDDAIRAREVIYQVLATAEFRMHREKDNLELWQWTLSLGPMLGNYLSLLVQNESRGMKLTEAAVLEGLRRFDISVQGIALEETPEMIGREVASLEANIQRQPVQSEGALPSVLGPEEIWRRAPVEVERAELRLLVRNHVTPGTVMLDAEEMNEEKWRELFVLATTYPQVKFVVYGDKTFSNDGILGEIRDLSNVVISRDDAETAFQHHGLRKANSTALHLSGSDVTLSRRKFQVKNQSRIVFARHNPQAMSLLETMTYLLLYAESGNSLYNIVARDGTIRSELRYMAIVQEHLNQLVISIAA